MVEGRLGPGEKVMVDLVLQCKADRARELLRELSGTVVAFSGGVDSTLLLYLAHQALGERCVAVTAVSPSLAHRERGEAADLARTLGVRHLEVPSREFDRPEYVANGPGRCYFCKTELFTICERTAREMGFESIVYGAMADDVGENRPGMSAARERGIRAPLLEAGLGKDEIRALSREYGLPTWNKPALACLASRLPTGTRVTPDRLDRVERAEEALRQAGFHDVRVRYHGDVARIELGASEWGRMADPKLRERISKEILEAGFRHVSLDLRPYGRTGPSGVRDR